MGWLSPTENDDARIRFEARLLVPQLYKSTKFMDQQTHIQVVANRRLENAQASLRGVLIRKLIRRGHTAQNIQLYAYCFIPNSFGQGQLAVNSGAPIPSDLSIYSWSQRARPQSESWSRRVFLTTP